MERGAQKVGIDSYLKSGFTYIYLAGLITFFLGVLYLYRKERKKYLLYFNYFWIFSILATFANILFFHFGNNIFILLHSLMHLFEAFYLIKAVNKYFNKELAEIWYRFLKFLLFVVASAFIFTNKFFILAPSLIYLSLAFLQSAKLIFYMSYNEVLQFAAVITGLFGLNLLVFPYLITYNWFNDFGIFIKGLLGLLFGISIFAVYYEDLHYKLKVREEQYTKLFDQSPAGMLLLDKHGEIVKVNNSITEYTGFSKKELEGKSVFENLVPLKFKIRAQKNIKEILAGQDKEYIMETYDKNNNKRYFLMKETKFTLPDYSNCVLSMRIDYTDYKKQQQRIRYLSYHDNLTKLYNRTFMEEEMKRLDKSRQLPISIIMIDVNGLKLFNDSYGHKKGDQLLVKTSNILNNSTRNEDMIARWAGDEFVILLAKTSAGEMQKIINRIERKCAETEGDEIFISLAIGAAVKNTVEESIFDVFDRADKKMYKQKLSGSSEAKKKIIDNILMNLGNKSFENKDHLKRMKETALTFANHLNLKKEDRDKLVLLAELHDLGKISISESILRKENQLQSKEWEKIKEHSELGYKIAAASKEFAFLAQEILHHHEHWDGSGYPAGIKGEEIPYLARIISIIDAYDIMRNNNIYSKKLSKKDAVNELLKCSGSQFDPVLTDKFVEFIN